LVKYMSVSPSDLSAKISSVSIYQILILADKSEGDKLSYSPYRGDNLIYTYTTNLGGQIWRW
jgi:hypothetical protein